MANTSDTVPRYYCSYTGERSLAFASKVSCRRWVAIKVVTLMAALHHRSTVMSITQTHRMTTSCRFRMKASRGPIEATARSPLCQYRKERW